ncbi:MAG: hypothetical protein J6V25_03145, partial [Oscillospiraceae bacterium]|nr:hypothetical protein [Oscillospiraceae bacterium]
TQQGVFFLWQEGIMGFETIKSHSPEDCGSPGKGPGDTKVYSNPTLSGRKTVNFGRCFFSEIDPVGWNKYCCAM